MRKLQKSIKSGNLRKVLYLVLFCFSVLSLVPNTGEAVVVSDSQNLASIQRTNDLTQIRAVLEKKEIQSRLESFGLSSVEIEKRLSLLTDEELHKLATELDKLNPAGDGAGILVFLLIIALVIVILYSTGVIDFNVKVEKKKKKP